MDYYTQGQANCLLHVFLNDIHESDIKFSKFAQFPKFQTTPSFLSFLPSLLNHPHALFYVHTFYLYAHQIVPHTCIMERNSLMTRNVNLHYFSWYYHASNSLMQGTSFPFDIWEYVPKAERSSVWIPWGFLWKCRWAVHVRKSAGAIYSDVNDVVDA